MGSLNSQVARLVILIFYILPVGCVFCQDIQFEGLGKSGSLKRGKIYQMRLTSTTDPVVTIQLLQQGVLVKEGPAVLISGSYQVYIPATLERGSYTIAVLNTTNIKVFAAEQVHITSKVPLWAKIGTGVLISSGLLLLAST